MTAPKPSASWQPHKPSTTSRSKPSRKSARRTRTPSTTARCPRGTDSTDGRGLGPLPLDPQETAPAPIALGLRAVQAAPRRALGALRSGRRLPALRPSRTPTPRTAHATTALRSPPGRRRFIERDGQGLRTVAAPEESVPRRGSARPRARLGPIVARVLGGASPRRRRRRPCGLACAVLAVLADPCRACRAPGTPGCARLCAACLGALRRLRSRAGPGRAACVGSLLALCVGGASCLLSARSSLPVARLVACCRVLRPLCAPAPALSFPRLCSRPRPASSRPSGVGCPACSPVAGRLGSLLASPRSPAPAAGLADARHHTIPLDNQPVFCLQPKWKGGNKPCKSHPGYGSSS